MSDSGGFSSRSQVGPLADTSIPAFFFFQELLRKLQFLQVHCFNNLLYYSVLWLYHDTAGGQDETLVYLPCVIRLKQWAPRHHNDNLALKMA